MARVKSEAPPVAWKEMEVRFFLVEALESDNDLPEGIDHNKNIMKRPTRFKVSKSGILTCCMPRNPE
jgi:hypothetical protein